MNVAVRRRVSSLAMGRVHMQGCRCNACGPRHGASCRCGSCGGGRRVYSTEEKPVQEGEETSSDAASNAASNAASAEGKMAQLQDSYLRCLADMENLRQRTRREVDAASSFAIQKFCKDIVGVADVLELALGSVRGDPRTAALLEGRETQLEEPDTPSDGATVDEGERRDEQLLHQLKDLSVGLSMTLTELVKVFAKHGVTAIDPMHQKFDPNYHMAMYEVPNGELEAGTVVSVQKKGYLLNHRVIRPASVGISKKP